MCQVRVNRTVEIAARGACVAEQGRRVKPGTATRALAQVIQVVQLRRLQVSKQEGRRKTVTAAQAWVQRPDAATGRTNKRSPTHGPARRPPPRAPPQLTHRRARLNVQAGPPRPSAQ